MINLASDRNLIVPQSLSFVAILFLMLATLSACGWIYAKFQKRKILEAKLARFIMITLILFVVLILVRYGYNQFAHGGSDVLVSPEW